MSEYISSYPDNQLPRVIRELTDCLVDLEDRYRDLGRAYHRAFLCVRTGVPPIPDFEVARQLFGLAATFDDEVNFQPQKVPEYGAIISTSLTFAQRELRHGDCSVAKHYISIAVKELLGHSVELDSAEAVIDELNTCDGDEPPRNIYQQYGPMKAADGWLMTLPEFRRRTKYGKGNFRRRNYHIVSTDLVMEEVDPSLNDSYP